MFKAAHTLSLFGIYGTLYIFDQKPPSLWNGFTQQSKQQQILHLWACHAIETSKGAALPVIQTHFSIGFRNRPAKLLFVRNFLFPLRQFPCGVDGIWFVIYSRGSKLSTASSFSSSHSLPRYHSHRPASSQTFLYKKSLIASVKFSNESKTFRLQIQSYR